MAMSRALEVESLWDELTECQQRQSDLTAWMMDNDVYKAGGDFQDDLRLLAEQEARILARLEHLGEIE